MSRSRLFDGVHFFICPPVTHVAGVRKYEAAQLVSAADLAAEIVAHGGGLLTTLTAAGAVAPRADGLPAVFAVGNPSQCYHASDEFRRVAQSPKLPPGAAPRSPSLLLAGAASSVTFIRPAFIKDSIAAQALLSHAPYLVFNPSPSPSFAAAAASTVAAADQSPKSPGGASSYRAADSGPSLENSLRLPAGTHLMLEDADHKVVDDDDVSDIEHDIASEMHQLAELIDMSSDHIQRVAELEEKLNAIIATGVAVLEARPRKSASASNTSF